VESCTIAANQADAITIHNGGVVRDGTVRGTRPIGIIFSGGCQIIGNTCGANASAGIFRKTIAL
jgi:hypothetical protein